MSVWFISVFIKEVDSHIVSPWAHENDTHKSLSLVWSVMIGWELFVWFHLHILSECSNLGIVLEFVSKGGLGCCFSVRMNVLCVCFILTDCPYVLYVSISFSSQYMDTTFCFSKISPVLPVMVGRVFVCFIRLPYLCGYCKVIRLETAWRILLSVKIAFHKLYTWFRLSYSTKNKKPPGIQRTLPVRDIQPEPDSTD